MVVVVAGCGSQATGELPAAAGPRQAPPLTTRPAGRIVRHSTLPARLGPVGSARTAVDDGARQAIVDGRARQVTLRRTGQPGPAERADAGVGPTRAVSEGRWLWVADTRGDALLVFRVRPALELVRRVYLPGGPYAIALDPVKHRLWVTLTATNEVVELPAHGRPSLLRSFPTVRQPDAVGVDAARGVVYVRGDGGLQAFTPGPLQRG